MKETGGIINQGEDDELKMYAQYSDIVTQTSPQTSAPCNLKNLLNLVNNKVKWV